MTYEPEISVIVPTYGRADFLRAALSSLRSQTVQNWRCWVVNDKPDETHVVDAVVAGCADSRFHVLHNTGNCGAAASRNAGIEASCGQIVAFLDDDDQWLPEHLREMLHGHAEIGRPALVYSNYILRWEHDSVTPRLGHCKSPPESPFDALLRGSFSLPNSLDRLGVPRLPQRCGIVRRRYSCCARLGPVCAYRAKIPVPSHPSTLGHLRSALSATTDSGQGEAASRSSCAHEKMAALPAGAKPTLA